MARPSRSAADRRRPCPRMRIGLDATAPTSAFLAHVMASQHSLDGADTGKLALLQPQQLLNLGGANATKPRGAGPVRFQLPPHGDNPRDQHRRRGGPEPVRPARPSRQASPSLGPEAPDPLRQPRCASLQPVTDLCESRSLEVPRECQRSQLQLLAFLHPSLPSMTGRYGRSHERGDVLKVPISK